MLKSSDMCLFSDIIASHSKQLEYSEAWSLTMLSTKKPCIISV